MPKPRTISFVGAGALANGLAKLLRAQGYTIAEIVARDGPRSGSRKKKTGAAALAREVGAATARLATAKLACEVLWLAVPDAAIETAAAEIARVLSERANKLSIQKRPVQAENTQQPHSSKESLRGAPTKLVQPRVVLHASGALTSQALAPLAALGIHTGSAHPMMTFVAGEPPSLEGAWFAVEGAPAAVRAAREMARKLGANSFSIEPGSKTLYHAFGAMLSPMLATELEAAERVGLRAGIDARQVRRIMEPIVLRTVRNVLRNGAGKSFSGPLARGDVSTVAAHLEALRAMPEGDVYRALMEYATETLPVNRREEMKKLLEIKKPARRGSAREAKGG